MQLEVKDSLLTETRNKSAACLFCSGFTFLPPDLDKTGQVVCPRCAFYVLVTPGKVYGLPTTQRVRIAAIWQRVSSPPIYLDGATRKSGGIEVEQPLQWS